MDVIAVHFAMNTVMELLYVHAICRLINIRSKVAYCAATMIGLYVCLVMYVLDMPPLLRTLVVGPILTLVLPICFSRGPLAVRVTRVIVVSVGMVMSELLSSLFAVLTSPSGVLEPGFPRSLLDVVSSGAVMIMAEAVIFRLIIIAFERLEHRDYVFLEGPALIFIAWTYFLTMYLATQSTADEVGGMPLYTVEFACVILALGLSFVAIVFSREYLLAARASTNRTASLRQIRHLRAEIEPATRRTVSVHQLRHDMVHQTNPLVELVRHGHMQEAESQLATLRERAHSIAESDDE